MSRPSSWKVPALRCSAIVSAAVCAASGTPSRRRRPRTRKSAPSSETHRRRSGNVKAPGALARAPKRPRQPTAGTCVRSSRRRCLPRALLALPARDLPRLDLQPGVRTQSPRQAEAIGAWAYRRRCVRRASGPRGVVTIVTRCHHVSCGKRRRNHERREPVGAPGRAARHLPRRRTRSKQLPLNAAVA
jgi:hypothetical protein